MEEKQSDTFESPSREDTPKPKPPSTFFIRPTYTRSAASSPNFSKLAPLITHLPSRAAAINSEPSERPRTLHRISTVSDTLTQSRPESRVFPLFLSSLSYALVRDFAYPIDHPLHYGPLPEDPLDDLTPGSDYPFTRRMSDPTVLTNYPPNDPEDIESSYFLPRRTYGDLDEHEADEDDLVNPSLLSRHRKVRSNLVDYDTSRGKPYRRSHEKNDFYLSTTPELQEIDSPSRSPSESYEYENLGPIATADEDFQGRAVALFDFSPENDNELPFIEGQVLWINYRHGEGWLVGQDLKSGQSGLVPEAYVRLVRDIEGGLHSLKGEAYDPDSPSVADIDTPTEAQYLRSSLRSSRYTGPLLHPLSTRSHDGGSQTLSTSQSATPTAGHQTTPPINLSKIQHQQPDGRPQLLGSDVFGQGEQLASTGEQS